MKREIKEGIKEKLKIYDCFTFFNELELLEIRLSELYNYVDYFVIAEGDKTHAGKSRQFIFEKNKKRYKKWEDKIIYIKVKMPTLNIWDKLLMKLEKVSRGIGTRFIGSNFRMGRWKLENFQRSELKRGLKNCSKEDIIMVSDVDEIPNPAVLNKIKKYLKVYPKIGLEQEMFNKYLNGSLNKNWVGGTKATTFYTLQKKYKGDPQRIRIRDYHFILLRIGIKEKIKILEEGGWHFQNVGNKDAVLKKINSKAEADLIPKKRKVNFRKNYENYESIGIEKKTLKIIPIDNSFPRLVLKDKDKYIEKGLIRPYKNKKWEKKV